MLLPVYYIRQHFEHSNLLKGDEAWCYPSSLFIGPHNSSVIKKLFDHNAESFCILLDSNFKCQELSDTVTRILFHPSYLNPAPLSPCFLVAPGLTNKEEVQSTLTSKLKKQGFSKPVFFDLTTRPPGQSLSVMMMENMNFEEGYFAELIYNYTQRAGIAVNISNTTLEAARLHIQKAEDLLQISNPNFYSILYHAKQLADMEKNTASKNFQLTSRLRSLAQYDFNSNENTNFTNQQVKAINEFYKYEYEILPKWYKQFGHLLKVIMGRRTFKSLYRDNVKKYKG